MHAEVRSLRENSGLSPSFPPLLCFPGRDSPGFSETHAPQESHVSQAPVASVVMGCAEAT